MQFLEEKLLNPLICISKKNPKSDSAFTIQIFLQLPTIFNEIMNYLIVSVVLSKTSSSDAISLGKVLQITQFMLKYSSVTCLKIKPSVPTNVIS